ncbi:glycoside hydrolase [Dipodascopsis uninucleata]
MAKQSSGLLSARSRRLPKLVWASIGIVTILADCESSTVRILQSEYSRVTNESLKWGPYRSNLYYGMRPRGGLNSFFSGLMWYNVNDFRGVNKIRHSCEQGDEMDGYGWTEFDPRVGGRQVMHDVANKVDIYTELVKNPSWASGNDSSPEWVLRVRGVPRSDDENELVFYFGLDGFARSWRVDPYNSHGYSGTLRFRGESQDVGDFGLVVTKGSASNTYPIAKHSLSQRYPSQNIHMRSLFVEQGTMWHAKDYYMNILQGQVDAAKREFARDDMPPPVFMFNMHNDEAEGNIHFIQRVFAGEFQFDIVFGSPNVQVPTETDIATQIKNVVNDFDKRYESTFEHSVSYSDPEYKSFGKKLVSDLMGGVGYFYGSSLVDRSENSYDDEEEEQFWEHRVTPSPHEEGPFELFTAVPSRPFFPRGFYWDEGFHLVPIARWDPGLAFEIMKSWFALMDDDGWIAREQILGPEARSKVPEEFQVQFPTFANPPTLFIAIADFAEAGCKAEAEELYEHVETVFDKPEVTFVSEDKIRDAYFHSPELSRAALKKLYPRLVEHFNWFRRTQSADIRAWYFEDSDGHPPNWREGYRWRGRTPRHCLTSGLDDYPRSLIPHPAEMHVDLMAWIGSMASAIKKVAKFMHASSGELEKYDQILQDLQANLDALHWNSEKGLYCDLGWDAIAGKRVHECHEGYVSLMPFLLGIAPLDKVETGFLSKIVDADGLRSKFGIRSLSKRDPYFGKDENYWRGSIWINMNYLALKSMSDYYSMSSGDSNLQSLLSDVYSGLRKDIIDTVYNEYVRSNFMWEQYNEADGTGKGVKHFAGWTSIVAVIMNMSDTLK